MPVQAAEQWLRTSARQDIFRLLVTAQDLEMTVAESRQMVVDTFGLSSSQVIEIEQEGLASGWPPL